MAKYVDGYLLVVPKDKADLYKKMAEQGRDLWMKYGALGYYETRGDDLVPQEMGGVTARSFTEMTGAKDSDTIWYSFVIFASKEQRDAINAKVMEEMGRLMEGQDEMEMPFDLTKMMQGGFQVEVEG